MDETSQRRCPSCRETLADNAVLCIACGYHLGLGKRLATEVEPVAEVRLESNPYVAPAMEAERSRPTGNSNAVLDLDDSAARHAKAIADDAAYAITAPLVGIICAPIALIALPWFGYRLIMWHSLFNKYEELRHPNSFSPHAEVATRFRDARPQLWIGCALALVIWAVQAIALFRILL